MADAETGRKSLTGQTLLLVAGFLVLVLISASSVILVNQARDDNASVVHTIEVENQISTLLLELRRAESSARGYLLTVAPAMLADHERAVAAVTPAVETLARLAADNPVQVTALAKLRPAVTERLGELERAVDFVKNNDIPGGVGMLRAPGSGATVRTILDVTGQMRAEEDRLFTQRSQAADRTQLLASSVTVAGSALVIILAAGSIFLVRRSTRARDLAETKLRDSNVNLEETVSERTADLREANEEIQRFAYIVSHDLRSPLVNIMGFTSELEELHNDIFSRLAKLDRDFDPSLQVGDTRDLALEGDDKRLSDEFTEAIGFIKSSIGKMDRLIAAILQLTREGRREFKPERIDVRELIDNIAKTVAHQAAEADAEISAEPLPDIVSDRLALEQIFSNLIDNALKYLKPGVPGKIAVKGRRKTGYIIYDVSDNGRGIEEKDHQRIFDLFRRAGTQDRPGQGIGLAHVRALVRRMGGTLSVSSSAGEGSTFTVMLPTKWNLS